MSPSGDHLPGSADALRQRMSASPAFGFFSKTVDSSFIEGAGYAGMDFVILDTEHGPASRETLQRHLTACAASGLAGIVRVNGVDANNIGSALDLGASGVQVPNIETVEQAKAAVAAARFHPMGLRGVCRYVRAAKFSTLAKEKYFQAENRKIVILQIEGRTGMANLDDILKVTGFDVLFVGPYDLSQAVGRPGEVDHPDVLAVISEIEGKAKASGITLGIFVDDPQTGRRMARAGFRYIACSVDVGIWANACSSLVSQFSDAR